ncbi:hypothetical protein EJ08DRAFT_577382 [Tothia fuscella]|uniref:Uncharacterized protein n=1 Tax=Tothia fuscella TaxID=1048955 RepID=A0A9P4U3F1_9PEZI|nr:hypothetical protein EJ08DRAFT_577382 [Tothia fuscella]
MPLKHGGQLFNALVRTHHITSRKKVAHLKRAANTHSCYVLLRSGGCPGIMYCEGDELGVKQWIAFVQSLRYKDYQLAARPALVQSKIVPDYDYGKIFEVATVKEFSARMSERGVLEWWRSGMGYTHDEDDNRF